LLTRAAQKRDSVMPDRDSVISRQLQSRDREGAVPGSIFSILLAMV